MKKIYFLLFIILFSATIAYAINIGSGTINLINTLACEDVSNNICKVEQRFSYDGNITADKQIKAAPGFIHQIVCIGTDAAATAGTIILYDNTAESGTIIFSWAVQAVAYTQPVTIPLDVVAGTGLYLGFTTTGDITCTVSYR